MQVRAPQSITLPLAIVALVVAGAALHIMQPVLVPFVVALFFSNLFRPIVVFLRDKHVPMAIVLLFVVVLVGGILFGVSVVAVSSVQSLIAAMPRYEARWNSSLLPGIQHLLDSAPASIQDQLKNLQWNNIVQVSSIFGLLYAGAGGFVSMLSGLGLILLFMLFILEGNGLFERKIRAAYPNRQEEIIGVIKRIDQKTERYFITVTIMNVVSGGLSIAILSAFGVDLAIMWGLITFLVNFVPTLGSIISISLPIIFAFLQFDTIQTPIAMALVLIAVQFVWGSILVPRIMGSSLDMSPLLVMISLIFWGWVWGAWGMVLSVPITSMIKIALESIPTTKPLAILASHSTPTNRT